MQAWSLILAALLCAGGSATVPSGGDAPPIETVPLGWTAPAPSPQPPERPAVAELVLVERAQEATPAPAAVPALPPPRLREPTPRDGRGVIYLTFDDGPDPVVCGQVLATLKAERAPATFFVVGQRVLRYPEVTRRMFADGHTIGNHSWDHARLTAQGYGTVLSEITRTQDVVTQVIGVRPALFRPPYGATNPRVATAAAAAGLRTVNWTVDPRDWAQPGAGAITARVVAGARPGAIVLLHCLHPQTVVALPQIIRTLRARGYQFAAL